MPKSIKDLANPIYKDQISVTDVKASSTAWLLIQGLVSAYGDDAIFFIRTIFPFV